MMTEDEITGLLVDAGALLDGHFRLSSGLHSGRYLQCAVALQHPRLAETLGSALAERCRRAIAETIDTVVSPALGGLIIGHEVGRGLAVRSCFTERVEGVMTLRRGFVLEPGESVLIVEDVVTTGKSTQETVEVVRAHGADPVGLACIANRSGRSTIGDLALVSLIDLEIPAYEAADCPQCAAGEPLQKPGSRPLPS
jgi:orotate phosphoribosyltransferase